MYVCMYVCMYVFMYGWIVFDFIVTCVCFILRYVCVCAPARVKMQDNDQVQFA